jgi:dienelactone hydrolase
MRSMYRILIVFYFLFFGSAFSEPIYHEKKYPSGNEPFPVVILLHSSGGFKSDYMMRYIGSDYLKNGFAIYAPDFFKRHGITSQTRKKTWTTYREPIEKELSEIVAIVKQDKKIDSKNIFAVGFSNGGYWATYLAGTKQVNAASSHYGVWTFKGGLNGYPTKYIKKDCNPLLVLHPKKDKVQQLKHVKSHIAKAEKSCSAVKVHYYDKGGHAWESQKYQGGVGYNKDVWKDAVNKTITFFKNNMK